jgi:hypothetical protein
MPSKIGTEFEVNAHVGGVQNNRKIATLNNDNLIIVWNSYGQDGSGYGVYGQVFDPTAGKVGNEFQRNTYTTDYVAILDSGNFVVVGKRCRHFFFKSIVFIK